MGPDLKLTENSEHDSNTRVAGSVSNNEKKGSVAQNQENKGIQGNLDIEVDCVECMNSGESKMIDVECQDATEYSSSFGDTVSGDENGMVVNDEVESPLFGSLCDGSDGLFRMGKRRLTDHWKRFIHPVIWRCKWLEVKVRELTSQALKYERELTKYNQNKQFDFEKVTSEGFDAKSQAFPSKIQRKEVMKRKKRKRVEDTADVASYMSNHNVFSYYESKKSDFATATASASASALGDNCSVLDNKTVNGYDDIGYNDGLPFRSGDGDSLTEQILRKIEAIRSRIRTLKTRMNNVVIESPQKFSSINKLSLVAPPTDALNNSGNHPYAENGDRNSLPCTTSRHASECDKWDNFMPEGAVSSHGEVALIPNLIRSMSQRMLEISPENIEGEILIPNQAAKEELRDFGTAIIQQVEKSHVLMEKPKTASPIHSLGDNSPINTTLQPNAQPPYSKSKQTDEKMTSGMLKLDLTRWSRRSSG